MKNHIYPRLALDGIKKNKKLYRPYLLTCILMISMFYIVAVLAESPMIANMSGGGNMQMMFGFGKYVIGIFSVIFLLYTNSFLIRRRKKEFALYNVLGMSKKNLARVLFWETLDIYGFSIVLGLFGGIALSKMAELVFFRMIREDVNYQFYIGVPAILLTAVLFAIIFAVILLNSLRQIGFSNTMELVRGENVGEKPPKGNFLFGIAGLGLLGGAYFIAVSIKRPLEAFAWFFIAVLMVIVATYLLFISGSVVFCRLLKKNKKYYYNKKHYVSVSSMVYRMKRNGAGLASICVLLTMVLVTISSTASLYFGAEDCIRQENPRDISVGGSFYGYNEKVPEYLKGMEEKVSALVPEGAVKEGSVNSYLEFCIGGYYSDGAVDFSRAIEDTVDFMDADKIIWIHFMDIEDYNRLYGKDEKLSFGEAVACIMDTEGVSDVLRVGEKEFTLTKKISSEEMERSGFSRNGITSNIFLFVPDVMETVKDYAAYEDKRGDKMLLSEWYYQFDTTIDADAQLKFRDEARPLLGKEFAKLEGVEMNYYYANSLEWSRREFYSAYGGLFFIGILMSLVFLGAAVLIIYYKQISEGYEDQSRFEIMQKVGMTKRDIRKTINSQVLIVFLLPILFAALHNIFAFPVVNQILRLFYMFNTPLFASVTAVCILLCGLFYVIVYKITSNSYYDIVKS